MSLWWNDKEIREATSVLHTKTELSKFKKPQLIQMFMDRQGEEKNKFIIERRTLVAPVSDFETELIRQSWEIYEYQTKPMIEENKELKRQLENLKRKNATPRARFHQ